MGRAFGHGYRIDAVGRGTVPLESGRPGPASGYSRRDPQGGATPGDRRVARGAGRRGRFEPGARRDTIPLSFDAVINNTRTEENAQNGVLCEKGWVTLQAASARPGVTIQNNASGSGIDATCGCHLQFEGPAWIGQNDTRLTAMFAAVIDLTGRSDVTLANAVVTPPPASEPEPPTSPPGTRPPDGPPMILPDVDVTPLSQCEMVSDHQGMIMGRANAQIVGVRACAAKDLRLCQGAPD